VQTPAPKEEEWNDICASKKTSEAFLKDLVKVGKEGGLQARPISLSLSLSLSLFLSLALSRSLSSSLSLSLSLSISYPKLSLALSLSLSLYFLPQNLLLTVKQCVGCVLLCRDSRL
jgi:hypothetical protein